MNDRKALVDIKRSVRANDVHGVRQLLRHDPRLAIARGHGWTAFQDAAFQGKTQILEVMFAEGVGITPADIAQALHHAVQLPHADPAAVQVLCATGHVSDMVMALYQCDADALAQCLQADPSLAHSKDADDCPIFIRAAENGQDEMVLLLLAHGADIEARGRNGQSALLSCVCNQIDRTKRATMLRLLLARGAAVDGKTERGRTPLFSAATAGWAPEDSVRILLEHGADPNIRNEDGLTALQEVLRRPTARAQRVARLLRAGGAHD